MSSRSAFRFKVRVGCGLGVGCVDSSTWVSSLLYSISWCVRGFHIISRKALRMLWMMIGRILVDNFRSVMILHKCVNLKTNFYFKMLSNFERKARVKYSMI